MKNPRNCTTCRACIDEYGEDRVILEKNKTHFLFEVESVGQMKATTVVQRSIEIMRSKVKAAMTTLEHKRSGQEIDEYQTYIDRAEEENQAEMDEDMTRQTRRAEKMEL